MIRPEEFPFQVDRPTFVRVPFTANGRQWDRGEHFPWKELSVDDNKVRILYNQRTLFHDPAKETGMRVGDGLEALDVDERLNSVRLLSGDTDTNDQQLQNEEIDFSLTQTGNNVYYSAAWVARAISSKYSRLVDTELDGVLTSKYSTLAKQYTALADNLEYQGKTSGAVIGIKAGGISVTAVKAVRENTDRIKPSFRRDRFKNPASYDNSDSYDYNS